MSTKRKATLEGYGDHVFTGEIAAPYLKSQGLSEDALESSAWTSDGRANKVKNYLMYALFCYLIFYGCIGCCGCVGMGN